MFDAGKRAANEMTAWGGESHPFHAGATQKKIVEARVSFAQTITRSDSSLPVSTWTLRIGFAYSSTLFLCYSPLVVIQ